jgi:hypothetical protein
MGMVMIRCPVSGHELATGIEADRRSFAATPVFFSRTYCPACRADHQWFARDAWVCDTPPRVIACSGEVDTGSPTRTCATEEPRSMSRSNPNGTCSEAA